jgi:hypothetical protein
MADARRNVNIELTERNHQQLKRVRARTGMTQKVMVGRLIDWFCEQDEAVQALVLGQLPASVAPVVARSVLDRWLNSDHVAATVEAIGRERKPDPNLASDPAGPRPTLMAEVGN